MSSDLMMKAMNAVHRAVLGVSGGRIGWRIAQMPVLKLTTTGRKTGQPRTVLLTAPLQLDSTLVVVASRGGGEQSPGWFLNLRDDPHVQVALEGGSAQPMLARVATTEERDELWPRIVADHRNYGDYQARTHRVIPLVFLAPAG